MPQEAKQSPPGYEDVPTGRQWVKWVVGGVIEGLYLGHETYVDPKEHKEKINHVVRLVRDVNVTDQNGTLLRSGDTVRLNDLVRLRKLLEFSPERTLVWVRANSKGPGANGQWDFSIGRKGANPEVLGGASEPASQDACGEEDIPY